MSPSSRLAAVYVGGMAGTLARAGVAEGIASPWATLLVNVVGALLLGYVAVALPARRPLLGTGFCGGLTTFSTLQLEVLELPLGDALAYLAASAVLGWAALALGKAAGVIVWIGVALLGGAGAVARDVLERRASLLVVNVLGSAALGALSGVTGDPRLLLGTGCLGAFTSFSGWTLEDRRRGIVHLGLGLAACALARALLGP